MFKGRLKKFIDIFMDGEYHVLYRSTDGGTTVFDRCVAGIGSDDRISVRSLRPTFKYWYADPIPMYDEVSKKTYVFMEVYDRFKDCGFIGVSEFDGRGRLGRPKVAIKEDFHMSFPQVFRYHGNTYMIPETVKAGGIRLYRMESSVTDWTFVGQFEGTKGCVDTVTMERDGRLYLLTCHENDDNRLQTKLEVFAVEDLERTLAFKCTLASCRICGGDSAVPSEYGYATRNGGKLIDKNGEFYRVVQRSTDRIYGEGIIFFRIKFSESRAELKAGASNVVRLGEVEAGASNVVRLGEVEAGASNVVRLEESEAGRLEMGDVRVGTLPFTTHRVGVHTYGQAGGYEVMDMFVVRFSLINTVRKLLKFFV